MIIKFFSSIVLITFFVGCNQNDKREIVANASKVNFIQPPIKNADVPFKEYTVNAEKGDTIFHKSGSIVLFPSNSFLDKEGNIIKGDVKVVYREFKTPIDFFLSGIPMNYDSLGKQYQFESSGMCEILAFKDNKPVFVNPKNKPEIHLVSQNKSTEHNLYFLDTIQQKWVTKGKSIVDDLSKKVKSKTIAINAAFSEIIEPIKPEKATNKKPIIKIAIDPASFKELLVYDNLQFQLEPTETAFNPKDTAGNWTDVELIKTNNKGIYRVKFSNQTRSVSYLAKPVLEGKDYDKALKLFEQKNRDYKHKMAQRLLQEQTNQQKYIQDSIAYNIQFEENKRIERFNALIEIRNREIEKQNAITEAKNKEIAKRTDDRVKEIKRQNEALKKEVERQNERIENEKKEFEKLKEVLKKNFEEAYLSDKLIRSFQIDGFGVWNCDKPISPNYIPIIASFKESQGSHIALSNISIFYKSFNGIITFYNNNIQVVKNADNMIVGVHNGRFAYLTYTEYNKLKINASTKEQTFTMNVVEEKDNNYEFIKTIVK